MFMRSNDFPKSRAICLRTQPDENHEFDECGIKETSSDDNYYVIVEEIQVDTCLELLEAQTDEFKYVAEMFRNSTVQFAEIKEVKN